ncbi:hypothetical protein ACFPRL_11315 [Pseudoclavibacter helvolus]
MAGGVDRRGEGADQGRGGVLGRRHADRLLDRGPSAAAHPGAARSALLGQELPDARRHRRRVHRRRGAARDVGGVPAADALRRSHHRVGRRRRLARQCGDADLERLELVQHGIARRARRRRRVPGAAAVRGGGPHGARVRARSTALRAHRAAVRLGGDVRRVAHAESGRAVPVRQLLGRRVALGAGQLALRRGRGALRPGDHPVRGVGARDPFQRECPGRRAIACVGRDARDVRVRRPAGP